MENGKKQYQTAGRVALLAYLKAEATETPQTADEIYGALRKTDHTPGRSSVYRMLGELAADGVVRKYQAKGRGSVYQFVGEHADCGGHLHLQCLSCGRVSHLKCDCSAEISARLMKTHGFLVDSGRSVLYGTCFACVGGGKENA